jgi:hypothetical protein
VDLALIDHDFSAFRDLFNFVEGRNATGPVFTGKVGPETAG